MLNTCKYCEYYPLFDIYGSLLCNYHAKKIYPSEHKYILENWEQGGIRTRFQIKKDKYSLKFSILG